MNTCGPSIDPDSTDPAHRGSFSISPFQTHSRYFYAPLGEDCCGRQFVDLYYQQHHPFPHCNDCARLVLGSASHLCWQCRTYFRRYGTGMMQQIMGVTPQRYNVVAVMNPERGPNQRRLPEEQRAQEWRDNHLSILQRPISQVLLPQPTQCEFWRDVSTYLNGIQNHRFLYALPTVPMPYFNDEALLPLPESHRLLRHGLSLYPEVIDVPNLHDDSEPNSQPTQD